ncbi:hypothetical protein vseg_007352 [Gypsophila vaccaria]
MQQLISRFTIFFLVASFGLRSSLADCKANNCMRKITREPYLVVIDSSLRAGKPWYPSTPGRGVSHQQIHSVPASPPNIS